MKLLANILFIFCTSTLVFGQTNVDLLLLQNHYESFEYSTVITKSNNLLLDKDRFTDETLVKIYELKAASYFAMSDQINSRKSFIDLLKINNEYKINDVTYSPKLISFFQNVKTEFLDILLTEKEKENSKTSDKIANKNIPINSNISNYRTAFAKSLILPGWGHLEKNENTKGWILTSASAITLGSMVYFIFDTNSKENDYLASANTALIQTNYNKYNKSYKIRNALIAAYAAIWLYSQIDLLFFSHDMQNQTIVLDQTYNSYNFTENKFSFAIRIPF